MNEAIALEHKFAEILRLGMRRGFLFDQDRASDLCRDLQVRRAELDETLRKTIAPFRVWYMTPKRLILKLKTVPFNPASRAHMAKALKRRYGWVPTEFTDGGKPKMDEAVLSGLSYPEAVVMFEYLTVQNRIGKLSDGKESWFKHVADDGRIRCRMKPVGTITSRSSHASPNLSGVPAVYSPWGRECRALFTVPDGFRLVGADASGLELRGLAHYLAPYDGGRYRDLVLNSDVHVANQEAAGITATSTVSSARDVAKTFIYAWLYGAGENKLSAITEKSVSECRLLIKRFMRNTPGLYDLKKHTQEAHKEQGYVVGLDGRHIPTRSGHSALNTLLQGFGAVVMKQAPVNLVESLRVLGLVLGVDWYLILHIHDEMQNEVPEEHADLVGREAVESIRQVATDFSLRCPLDAEYKVGSNWSETH